MKKLIIVHDAIGKIVSVGQVHGGEHANMGIMPAPGQSVLEVELTGDLAEKPLIDIHHHCVVDVAARKLALRSGGAGRARS